MSTHGAMDMVLDPGAKVGALGAVGANSKLSSNETFSIKIFLHELAKQCTLLIKSIHCMVLFSLHVCIDPWVKVHCS